MKADWVDILGEFNATTSTVYGMRVYASGTTTHGFYSGKEGNATYYQFTEFKSGLKKEEIFDNNNKAIGYVTIMQAGTFSIPFLMITAGD